MVQYGTLRNETHTPGIVLSAVCCVSLSSTEQPPENQVMASSMALHHSVIRCHQGRVTLLEEEGPVGAGPFTTEEGVVRRARAVLMVAAYRNQALHVFIRPAMLALAIHTTRSSQRGELDTQHAAHREVSQTRSSQRVELDTQFTER